jgi:glycosyltransferase involved in cell wall biosynthesis
VVNDGSTDNSAEIAENWGATVKNIYPNKGLANAFRTGLQECLKRGADIIVNTDADNQYCASDIQKIVTPIIDNSADIVIGARDIKSIKEFSPLKKCLQKLGSAVLRLLSSTKVQDAPSGFRAFSRDAAIKLNVFDNYTYTMETLIQAGAKGLKVISVPISVNPQTRKSKLVKNIFDYVFKSMKTTIRMFIVYRPFRFFASIAGLLGIVGLVVVLRFLYYFMTGDGNGHVQSLIFAAVFLISAVQLLIIAVIGDLLSINRKLLEDIQTRVKILELKK